jgi:biotin carboxyl carrier protein
MLLDATVDGRQVRVDVRGQGGRYTVVIDGQAWDVDARAEAGGFMSLLAGGKSHAAALERRPGGYTVHLREDIIDVELAPAAPGPAAPAKRAAAGPTRVTAPMPGRLVRILVQPGQEVRAGEGLVVMEAMKMENELRAPRAGRVAEVPARERQTVEMGALLVVLD